MGVGHAIISSGHIPVIATVAADETGQAYNINANTTAGDIAAANGAKKLLLITPFGDGIKWDSNGLIGLAHQLTGSQRPVRPFVRVSNKRVVKNEQKYIIWLEKSSNLIS